MSRARCTVVFALLFIAACSSATTTDDAVRGREALSPSANDKTAFDYFLGKGLTSFQAAGIVGNLDVESDVNPTAVESGGPGRGIAQWSVGGRWDTTVNDNVLAYASAKGESSTSLSLQLDFIWYELQTFADYGLSKLVNTTNVTDATIAFQTYYEGCGACDQAARVTDAEAALKAYGADDAGAQGTTDGSVSASDSAVEEEEDASASEEGGGEGTHADDSGVIAEPTYPSHSGSSGGSCAIAHGTETTSSRWILGALAFTLVARARRRRRR